MSSGDTTDRDLQRLLALALEARECGREPVLEDVCRERPDLVAAVAAALRRLDDLHELERHARDFDAMRGSVLAGRYRLDQRIGAGAMGVVYRGLDLELGRAVAVKVLQTALFAGPEAEARFTREAEALAALHHPHVVTVFDRGRTADGVMFLVMELLEGSPLVQILAAQQARSNGGGTANTAAATTPDDARWLARELGPTVDLERDWLRQAARWTAELASGLHAAHSVGVFHRDVKPSNVFIDRDGHAKLLDFGIAARAEHGTLATRGEGGLGTPAYMAPEQVLGRQKASAALDVYGLAATLYHLVTLRPPYDGTPSQVIASLQRHDPVPAAALRRGLPRDLAAILDHGMARRPQDRYAEAGALASDLRCFLAHQPVSVRPLGAMRRLGRRAARSAAVRVASVALLLGGGFVATRALVDARRAAHAQAYAASWDRLPPDLSLNQVPANRVFADEAHRAAVFALLDEATRHAADTLPSRLYRAAVRLDHGQAGGAADDVAAIADEYPSPFTTALAALYRAVHDGTSGSEAIDLARLPPAVTAADRYVLAFHTVRAGGEGFRTRVRELLAGPEFEAWPHAQDLVAGALVDEARAVAPTDPARSAELYQAVHDLTLRVEGALGRRTATTAHRLGLALLGLGRHADAVAPLRDGFALSPWAIGLPINLAVALRRIGSLEEAEAVLGPVLQRHPHTLQPYVTLMAVHLDAREFDEARAVVQRMPLDRQAEGERVRRGWEGHVDFMAALFHQESGDRDAARRLAREAAEKFAASTRAGSVDHLIADAIVADDRSGLVSLLLTALVRDPLSPPRIANLAAVLPASLEDGHVRALHDFLHALHRAVAPARPPVRDGADRATAPPPAPDLPKQTHR